MSLTKTLFLLFVCWTSHSLSQTADLPIELLSFDHIGVKDGLPAGYTTSIIEDNNGLLWIGTSTGLSSYDGYKVTSYINDKSDTFSIAKKKGFSILLRYK